MSLNRLYIFLLLAILGSACTEQDQVTPAPQVTAQGFYIGDVQSGTAGEFSDLKVRFEVAGRIASLTIGERSYSVDLAKTPERHHLPLFGLKQRVEVQRDVTLNFRNYINTKLTDPGEYEFFIEVTDKKGQSTHKQLRIEVQSHADESGLLNLPVESGEFQLVRIGEKSVEGAERFGIQWITTDEIHVTIHLRKADSHSGSLGLLTTEAYQRIKTGNDVHREITRYQEQEYIEFDTANNAAAGKHLIVKEQEGIYFLSILSSKTSLSQLGTTVTLTGEYKFLNFRV